MPNFEILHNPRCKKSRETLQLLEQAGIKPKITLYLDNPLSKTRIKKISKMLGMKPVEFTRLKEKAAKEASISKESSSEHILDAMCEYPILIERPIVIKDDTEAIIGRPPEDVKRILKKG